MRLSFRKKQKKNVGGRRSIVKDDSKSAETCNDIPEDILIEILVRLPASSLMRFKCVSKLWSSLISSRYFTDLFFNFSSSTKREHRVFLYAMDRYIMYDYMLFSSSLSNLDATSSFPTLNLDLTLPCIKNDCLEFVNALRGLMCFTVDRSNVERDTQIRIINHTTRQVLRLPLVESNLFLESDDYDEWNYFGYDPLNDEYKVLSTISTQAKNELRSETQVFVLGDGASWRNTKSLTSPPPPHHPGEGGISINGILYYGAQSYGNRSVLMYFDFSSEEFSLIELPLDNRINWDEELCTVVHYQDQVAVFDDSHLDNDCILDLWVLEDARKSEWSHKVLVLPCHQIKATLELDIFDVSIRGTSRSGEVTLCGKYVSKSNKSTYAFYDLENNRITRCFVIDPPFDPSFRILEADLWEDVESLMYLEL